MASFPSHRAKILHLYPGHKHDRLMRGCLVSLVESVSSAGTSPNSTKKEIPSETVGEGSGVSSRGMWVRSSKKASIQIMSV